MLSKVDPKLYGLPARTRLLKESETHFIIFIDRKSRIIMKDAKIIIGKARMIQSKINTATITIKTTAPVCSKSILLFQENKIGLEMV